MLVKGLKRFRRSFSTASLTQQQSSSSSLSEHISPILLGLEENGLHLKISDTLIYSLSHHQCRENCRCPSCTVQPSRHRNVNNSVLTNQNDSFQHIRIEQAGIDAQNKYIYLKWSDSHEGWIDLDEIINEDEDMLSYSLPNKPYKPWKNYPTNMTHFDYNDVMTNDEILYHSFYNELEENGMCLMTNSTFTDNTAIKIGERLANHLYPTVFGSSFTVDVKQNSENPAYTNIELKTHTDLPYYILSPEYFVFHCIENESTGNSIYNDGFCIAEEMRTHYPEQFEVLSSICVPFRDHQKGKWDISAFKHIIQLNANNAQIIDKIHYNEGVRSSIHWKISNSEKNDFYFALSIFSKMALSEEFTFERQLESGDVFIFNNTRILHGRRRFDGARKMQGCYFTKEGLMGMKKSLQFKLKYLTNQ